MEFEIGGRIWLRKKSLTRKIVNVNVIVFAIVIVVDLNNPPT